MIPVIIGNRHDQQIDRTAESLMEPTKGIDPMAESKHTERIDTIPVIVNNRAENGTHTRVQCQRHTVNPSNLSVAFDMKWNFPSVMNCNARSVNNKMNELQCISHDNGIDLVCITESWLVTDDTTITLDGYYPPFRNDRENRQGGGVLCFVRDNIKVKEWKEFYEDGIETLWLTIYPKNLPRNISCIILEVVYHPPKSDNFKLYTHISYCLDSMLSAHPNAGILLAGDFNQYKDSYLKQSYSLRQIVKEPTRGNHILDKIFTTMDQFYGIPKILAPLGASDHSVVVCHPQIQNNYKPPERITILKRSNDSNAKNMFVHALKTVDWCPLYNAETCDEKFSIFHDTISKNLNEFLPVIEVKRSSNDKPWITDNFRNKIVQRQHALNTGNKAEYNRLRNSINRSSKVLKKKFYKNGIEDLKTSNPSEWWRKTKVLSGTDSKSSLTNLVNNIYDGDSKTLARDVNCFFQSVPNVLKPLDKEFILPSSDIPSKYIIAIEDVENRMSKININKSSGPDELPNWIIRDLAPILSKPVTSLFNASIREASVPALWKCATITPLPKVSIAQNIETDLRPISLTSVLSKILESFVSDWLWDFVKDKLHQNQFGGVKNSSTAHALTKMLHDWHEAVHNNNSVRLLLVDYKKAFDLVDHNVLLAKLNDLDVPNFIINWIGAFLSDRKIRVRINNELSDWLKINGSVPQGSKLGPLLYVIMINDLQPIGENFNMYKFMDDSTLSEIILRNSNSVMQEAADSVVEWSDKNNTQINPRKTVEMLISFTKVALDVGNLTINGTTIERVKNAKLLGVIISDDLTWGNHVDEICKKANKRLHYLVSLRRAGLSKEDLIVYYKHVIRPVLEYCCVVWHTSLTVQQTEQIEHIQTRAMRIIGTDTVSLETLEKRRENQCIKFFNQIQSNEHVLHSLLPPQKQANVYNTRYFMQYPIPKCTTKRFKNSFLNFSLINRQNIIPSSLC